MPGRILFVGHDAHRAGAEIALLHILRWLRAERQEEPRVFLGGGGDLIPDYEQFAPTYQLKEIPWRAGLARRALRRLRLFIAPSRMPRTLRRERIDLVYLNTLGVAHLARELKATWHAPVLFQLRELEMSIRIFVGSERLRAALRHVDGCITATGMGAALLREQYGFPPERIHRVSPGLALPTRGAAWRPEARRALRAELGLPADAFVIGGCGSLNWWKSPDLFVLVAHGLRMRRPQVPVHFVWIGGTLQSPEHERLCHDVDHLGLGGMVRFLGAQPNPHQYFALLDTFLLTSREDSYPLVCIEAAALGLPIVCFGGSGGASELVEDDAGFVVPYLDLDAAADRLAVLMDDLALRHRLGVQAASKARDRHTLERMGQDLGPVLDRYLPRFADGDRATIVGDVENTT